MNVLILTGENIDITVTLLRCCVHVHHVACAFGPTAAAHKSANNVSAATIPRSDRELKVVL